VYNPNEKAPFALPFWLTSKAYSLSLTALKQIISDLFIKEASEFSTLSTNILLVKA
jgi:hypothetical protein